MYPRFIVCFQTKLVNMGKYGPACKSEGIVFQPLPIEVLGGFHEASEQVVVRLGQALARTAGQEESEVVKHLFGRLSILLQRGNCQLILNRMPNYRTPETDGVL